MNERIFETVVTTCAAERMTRARIGKKMTAMAMTVMRVPVPSTAMRLMASSRAGSTRISSTPRITTRSTRPPA